MQYRRRCLYPGQRPAGDRYQWQAGLSTAAAFVVGGVAAVASPHDAKSSDKSLSRVRIHPDLIFILTGSWLPVRRNALAHRGDVELNNLTDRLLISAGKIPCN